MRESWRPTRGYVTAYKFSVALGGRGWRWKLHTEWMGKVDPVHTMRA